jgi:putative endonuclease
MAESHVLGNTGEDLAAEYLTKTGYKILFRNWKWGRNEIDIIATKDDIIAFVEVKTRTREFLAGLPAAVPGSKQRSIIYAADGYVQKYKVDKVSRFDILTIIVNGDNKEIEYIEDAYYPTLR